MEAMEEVNEMIRPPVQLPEDIEMSDCQNVEERAEKMLLAPPEYDSFRNLAAEMIDVVSGGYCKISIIEEGDGPLVPADAEVEIHFAAYWENERVPFDSSVNTNMGARKKMRLGAGEILPVVDTALSMVRGPAARLILLAPVLPCKQRVGLQPLYTYKDTLFVISLYSVKEMALPLEEQKKNDVKTAYILDSEAHDLFEEKRRGPMVKYHQSQGSWARHFEEIPVKRLKSVENDSVSVLQNLELFEEKRRGPTVKYRQSVMGCWARHFEEIPVKRLMGVENDSVSVLQNFDYLTEKDIYCKASFYYGKAYQSSGKTDKARKFYMQALAMEPRNHVIRSTLDQLEAYLKKCARHEAFLWERGFDVTRKKNHYFDGDWGFEYSIRYMYQDLEERNEDVTLELPMALSYYEEICVRSLAIDFEGLAIKEERVRRNKKLTVVSTRLIRNLQ